MSRITTERRDLIHEKCHRMLLEESSNIDGIRKMLSFQELKWLRGIKLQLKRHRKKMHKRCRACRYHVAKGEWKEAFMSFSMDIEFQYIIKTNERRFLQHKQKKELFIWIVVKVCSFILLLLCRFNFVKWKRFINMLCRELRKIKKAEGNEQKWNIM